MLHQPSKEELKKLEALNKAYKKITDGLKAIKRVVPKDSEIALRIYRMEKEHSKIVKRMQKLLEEQFIDDEFLNIIKGSRNKIGRRVNEVKKRKK